MEAYDRLEKAAGKDAAALVRAGIVTVRSFEKRQVLLRAEDDENAAGILLSGGAFLENINMEDQRRIIDCYEPGDVFRRSCFPDAESHLYYVISRNRGQMACVDEKRLKAAGQQGRRLRTFLQEELQLRARRRTLIHVEILSQRSIRQKLLICFEYLGRQQGGDNFTLPFSLTDCADYLAVDRSAMMRELRKMKEEGLVEMKERRVRLCR